MYPYLYFLCISMFYMFICMPTFIYIEYKCIYIICHVTFLCCAVQMYFRLYSCLVTENFRSSHIENDYLQVTSHIHFCVAFSRMQFPELSFKRMFFPVLEMFCLVWKYKAIYPLSYCLILHFIFLNK